jgi:DHA2 family lincomycin resistance protein-like MFS transporter
VHADGLRADVQPLGDLRVAEALGDEVEHLHLAGCQRRVIDKFGPRPLIVPGSIAVSVAMWTLALALGNGSSWIILLGAHILLSLGLAFLFTPLFSTSLGSLKPHLYSHGSATIATLQQVAGAAGTAVFVALYATGLAAAGNLDPEHPSAAEAANGSHLAFIAGGIVSLAVIVLTLFVQKPDAPAHGGGEWAEAEVAESDLV